MIWGTGSFGAPWSFGEDFLPTLLVTCIFGGVLLGSIFGFLSYGNEGRPGKALRRFAGAGAFGLAIPVTAAVVFSFAQDGLQLFSFMPWIVRRALWWTTLAASLGAARGFWIEDTRAGCIALLGLVPGVTLAGVACDLVFFAHGLYLAGSLLLGIATGCSMGLAVELLKESWLEEVDGPLRALGLQRQFLLETEEFVAVHEGDGDFSLNEDAGVAFTIIEKDGIHILESLDGEPIRIGNGRYRYRTLLDGDAIHIGVEAWIYHTRWARTRDVLPEAAL
ncbi:MAG: hypothetical protein WA705_05970 [Candidatus Ozemobacteraceae bacterium]